VEDSSTSLGIATVREVERSSHGKTGEAQVIFEPNEAVSYGGLLFLVPALLEHGLLKAKDFYQLPDSHYYGVQSTIMTLAFMALARIKNPEQLKQCKPGELGRLIGLDRVPEVRCLRKKIKLFSDQTQSTSFNNALMGSWYGQIDAENQGFYYIDGHQRIYYGSKANLPVKYISRQKLCLSATTEFWVNDSQGLPMMMVIGQLTEKLQEAITDLIIPQMMEAKLLSPLAEGQSLTSPQCTFIFDREAYSPKFFHQLWQDYGIAVISYRKNVTDKYDEESFKETTIDMFNNQVTMQVYEGKITLGGYSFREIRKLNDDGHQVAVLTTHPSLPKGQIAVRMFGRWVQENYFKYLISDYDFDKIISFGIEAVDIEKKVVNPQYRKLSNKIKKVQEKIQRLEAKFFPLLDQVIDRPLEQIPKLTTLQAKYHQRIERLQLQKETLLKERGNHQPKIQVKQMPIEKQYNQLKTESKKLLNIIRMIAYRAETAMANLISPILNNKNADNIKRMIVKQIINSPVDIKPDYENKTLEVTLHHLSAERFNKAARELVLLLNQTQTVFPGTNMVMSFKTSV